jgi:hypothetical protein
MAQSKFFNLVKCSSSTVGTGPLTVGPAVSGFLDYTTGGVSSGDTVTYTLFDGPSPAAGQINASETGQGVATLSGGVWTQSRDIVRASTNDGMPINCSGKELIALTLGAEDIAALGLVKTIGGTFTADGAIAALIPAGSILVGGKITPNNAFGATVSLGTTSGGSDILPATVVPGTASGMVPLQGTNFLLSIFAADQLVFVHSDNWGGARMTIILWFLITDQFSP